MDSVTVIDCVDADPRPTCVLDLTSPDGPLIHHKNTALRAQAHLVHDILGVSPSAGLQAWAVRSEHSGTVTLARGTSLYAYTIQKRWRIMQWLVSDQEPGDKPGDHEENGYSSFRKRSPSEVTPLLPKADPLTLNRKLKDALQDRDDATGRLSNLLKMMEMSDVGMFEYTKEGSLVYGNEAFHRLTGFPKDVYEEMAWANWVFEEDQAWLIDYWTQLTEGRSCTFDMRWIGPSPEENPEGHWVSAACVPTTDDTGNVTTVSGCITDISAQKRSHLDAVRRAEALERAQVSERRFSNFITHSNVVSIFASSKDIMVVAKLFPGIL
jgi:PAS domain S-box-containing protein